MFKRIGAMLVALVFSSAASAGMIVDTVNQYQFVGWGGSHSYFHNLNDEGFVLGSAISGTIQIDIDDDRCCLDELVPEVILITIEAFDFDSGGISVFASNFNNNIQVNALASINADGFLDVTIQSILGDFWVGDSILTVYTASVPEPGTLALLGLGLLGLGFARRTRRA